MKIEELLQPLTKFVEMNALLDRIASVRTVVTADVEFTAALPSFTMGADGPTLDTIVLVTDKLYVDISVARQAGNHEFDIMARCHFLNYRYRFWKHEIKEGDLVIAVFDLADIKFLTGPEGNFGVGFKYAGTELAAWLAMLQATFSLDLIAPYS